MQKWTTSPHNVEKKQVCWGNESHLTVDLYHLSSLASSLGSEDKMLLENSDTFLLQNNGESISLNEFDTNLLESTRSNFKKDSYICGLSFFSIHVGSI